MDSNIHSEKKNNVVTAFLFLKGCAISADAASLNK
jgi:hypothetical protein